MLIRQNNSSRNTSSPQLFLNKQTSVRFASSFGRDLSPWGFMKDLYNLLYTIIYWFIRLNLQLDVFVMEGAMSLKKRGVRQLMGRRNRLYNKSFYVLLMIVGVLVFVGWSVSLPGSTDVNASNNDFYALAISPNDLFVEKGSLETLIPQSRARFDVEIYIVKPKDTLSKIANYFKVSADTLKWANNLKNTDNLKIGQKLNIPPGTGVLHKVKAGDTVKSIAKKYRGVRSAVGISQLIVEINWLDAPYKLTAGSTIFVPNGVIPAPVAPVVAVAPPINRYVPRYTPPRSITPPSNVGRFLSWPVAGGRGTVTQCPSAYHVAIDIADAGMPDLVAAADGTVIYAGRHNSGYAWMVMVDHGNGYTTLYAHMNRVYVKKGARVGRGQVLGQMGATGLATGVHVHFELRRGSGFSGRTTNAAPFMQNHLCGY